MKQNQQIIVYTLNYTNTIRIYAGMCLSMNILNDRANKSAKVTRRHHRCCCTQSEWEKCFDLAENRMLNVVLFKTAISDGFLLENK